MLGLELLPDAASSDEVGFDVDERAVALRLDARPPSAAHDAESSSLVLPLPEGMVAGPSRDTATPTPDEAQVPTRLVSGAARRAPHDGRYGGYSFVRELVRAPGVVLAEARDAIGVPWLLQLVRTRPVGDDAERLARQHVEHVVAARTTELLDEPGFGLRAHGVTDEPDGARSIYWVLPWHPRAPRLAADFAPRPSLDAVVRTALALARRLVRRHALGRTEPLLSASLVSLGDDTAAPVLLGFPVMVPPAAVTEAMVPSMLAPEERLYAQATALGDLWRLGQVLRRLQESCGEGGDALAGVVAQLSDPDPARRTPRATQVLAELEALGVSLGERAGTTQLAALDPTALAALMLSATADSTTLEAADVPSAAPAVVVFDDGERVSTPSPRALELALGLAIEALAATPEPSPATAPKVASEASMALAPFAVDLAAPADTVCEVATRLRIEPEDGDAAVSRTVVRTRRRPVVERAVRGAVDHASRGAVLDRRRQTPESEAERPSVVGVGDTQRIAASPRRVRGAAITEGASEEPTRPPAATWVRRRDALGALPTRMFVRVLLATAAVALTLGVVLGLAWPR